MSGSRRHVAGGLARCIAIVAALVLSTARVSVAQIIRTDSAAVALLERSAAAYQSSRTLRAQFTQTLTNPRTDAVFRSSGDFFQRGAQQFAFRFTDPPEDRIVADGAVIWLYLPSTAKGQVLKIPRAAGAGMDLASSLLREPARRYTVTAAPDSTIDGRTVRVVHLVPRTTDAAFTRGTVWVDPTTSLVRHAVFVEASGLVRTLHFARLRTGAKLPAGVFTFVPPAGVRIIDQAALLGGSVPRP